MRVVCENCGATYKIPETKLVKEVNKATCRKCGFRMMIRRPAAALSSASGTGPEPDDAATQVGENPLDPQDGENAVLKAETRIEKQHDKRVVEEWSDEAPTQVQIDPLSGKTTPAKAIQNSSAADRAPGDMLLALVGTFAAAAGPMLLATNTADAATQRMVGLLLGLWGALICLFLLVTGNLWRQKGNIPISVALATVLSMGGTAFVELAMHGTELPSAAPVAEKPQAPEDTPSVDKSAQDALAGDAETGDTDPDAATVDETEDIPVADAAPPPRRAPTPPPSTDRQASPPVDDSETLDEADIDDIPAAATRSDAEERRRREMEESAARARTEREARAQEAKEQERAKQARAAAAAPPAQPSAPKMKSLPLTVVDTMIRSNMSVKRCFFAEKQASGTLPSRVNVRFTVMPTGRVSSARVTTDEYKGGTLDSCLGRAFRAISFPGFEGDPLSMTYPFIL